MSGCLSSRPCSVFTFGCWTASRPMEESTGQVVCGHQYIAFRFRLVDRSFQLVATQPHVFERKSEATSSSGTPSLAVWPACGRRHLCGCIPAAHGTDRTNLAFPLVPHGLLRTFRSQFSGRKVPGLCPACGKLGWLGYPHPVFYRCAGWSYASLDRLLSLGAEDEAFLINFTNQSI